jgi:hypothetical protein
MGMRCVLGSQNEALGMGYTYRHQGCAEHTLLSRPTTQAQASPGVDPHSLGSFNKPPEDVIASPLQTLYFQGYAFKLTLKSTYI